MSLAIHTRRSRFIVSLAALAALLAAGVRDTPPATACSSSLTTVAVATRHPDLPLTSYVRGDLGLLQPTFARAHLVVAYRWLDGKPLDASEQAAVLALSRHRLAMIDADKVAPASSVAPTVNHRAIWVTERARVLGSAPAPAVSYTTASYVSIDNCLSDAFRLATDTLHDREAQRVVSSADLAAWVAAQDVVFKNCSDPKQKAIPQPLAAPSSALARADREYQIAAAYFYSNQWDEAERRFRAIGADASSPWSQLARVIVPRAIVRRATLAADKNDDVELGRALADVDAKLGQIDLASMHGTLRRYRSYIRARLEPKKLLLDVSRRLAAGSSSDTDQLVADYTFLLDADETVLKSGSESDVLTSWLGTVQGKRSFDFAVKMYNTHGTSLPWLVAGLMTATSANAKDTRLDPLLAQALAVPPDSPAFATVRYHFFRLAIARGSSRTALFEKVRHTRAALPRTTGISTRNAFTALAAETAPSVDAFLREATLVPAGVTDDSEPAIFVPDRPPALPPEIVDMIAMGLPLSGWRDAALSPLLPEPVRAHVAATAWTRAELLGDRATSKAVAAIAAKLNPALRVYVERIEKAKTDDERRLGVVFALLKLPTLGPRVDAWYASAAPAEGITTAYGHYLWCAEPPPVPGARAPSPAYATAAERDTATKERLALSKLGAGATWLAREAARLAHVLPDDPRIPEALHLAVRATRYACKDDGTRAASKGAFTALQKRYKDSSWAKATPHYY